MSPKPSTRQQLVKVPQVPCLYRHSLSGRYYGIKKLGGKRKEHSLSTSDRKLAERRLKVWIANLGKVDGEVERLTVREMLMKLQKANQGKATKTQATDASIIRKFEETWLYDLDMKVSEVRTSHLNEWLALHEKRLKFNPTFSQRDIRQSLISRQNKSYLVVSTQTKYGLAGRSGAYLSESK